MALNPAIIQVSVSYVMAAGLQNWTGGSFACGTNAPPDPETSHMLRISGAVQLCSHMY